MSIQFNDLRKPNPDHALIVDGLNLAFRYKHANKSDFGAEYLRTVQSLAHSYYCGRIIILADEGHSAYRRNLYPEYKGDRKEKYANQTEEEKQAFLDFFEDFNKTLDLVKKQYPLLKFKNVEADDLAAYIVKNRHKFGIKKVWLISSDKDWDTLVNEDVSRFSYLTRKETTFENWPYDVSVDNLPGFKALVGGEDNIKGVELIGPKKAATLLNQYGSIYDIVDAIPLPGKQKFIQNLNSAKDEILLNVNLMDLLSYCEDAIGIANIEEIDKCLTLS